MTTREKFIAMMSEREPDQLKNEEEAWKQFLILGASSRWNLNDMGEDAFWLFITEYTETPRAMIELALEADAEARS